ncbi:hypothetical protein D8I24_1572 [Cupriavidus necator H850]|nr:hypothetical protein D8I24_1572 [Cupriavidus necator H850]
MSRAVSRVFPHAAYGLPHARTRIAVNNAALPDEARPLFRRV